MSGTTSATRSGELHCADGGEVELGSLDSDVGDHSGPSAVHVESVNLSMAQRRYMQFQSKEGGKWLFVAAIVLTLTIYGAYSLFTNNVVYTGKGSGEAFGLAFLNETSRQPGVSALEDGLLYKVLRAGPGESRHPTLYSRCLCAYEGMTAGNHPDGQVFEANSDSVFRPSQVIQGWTMALQLMREGDQWELYIPPWLAYGDRPPTRKIAKGDTLVFRLELKQILDFPTQAPAAPESTGSRFGGASGVKG